MDEVKKIFDLYLIRKTKKQKENFRDWVLEYIKINNYEVKVEKGSMGAKNIIIGNVEEAKIIFGAHYDTCANMYIPNFCTPKNKIIYFLYQLGLTLVIFFTTCFILLLLSTFIPIKEVAFDLGYFIFLFLLCMITIGPANKNNYNDNTSGVYTILKLLKNVPVNKRKDVAFVLFDLEEAGLIGSSAFVSKRKEILKDKLFINFDCVGDGDNILLMLDKKSKNYVSIFKDMFTDNQEKNVKVEVLTKGYIYMSDQIVFPCGVGICSTNKSKKYKILYIDKIHTKKDVVLKEENIDYLVDNFTKFIDVFTSHK